MEHKRERLLGMLRERSLVRGPITLASGRKSDVFVDCKRTLLTAEGHALAGVLVIEAIRAFPKHEAVAGVELGGCPIASAVSLTSHLRGMPIDAIYVRKATKDHGSKRLVEGGEAGSSVVVLEDVVTTGGSTLAAVRTLTASGFAVVGVTALVDRLEGGREAIEGAGLRFSSVFTVDDVLERG